MTKCEGMTILKAPGFVRVTQTVEKGLEKYRGIV